MAQRHIPSTPLLQRPVPKLLQVIATPKRSLFQQTVAVIVSAACRQSVSILQQIPSSLTDRSVYLVVLEFNPYFVATGVGS